MRERYAGYDVKLLYPYLILSNCSLFLCCLPAHNSFTSYPAELAEKMDMPEDKIRKILKIAKEPISMETPIGDDED